MKAMETWHLNGQEHLHLAPSVVAEGANAFISCAGCDLCHQHQPELDLGLEHQQLHSNSHPFLSPGAHLGPLEEQSYGWMAPLEAAQVRSDSLETPPLRHTLLGAGEQQKPPQPISRPRPPLRPMKSTGLNHHLLRANLAALDWA